MRRWGHRVSDARRSSCTCARVNASAMGYQAVCLLEQGKYNRIVGMKGEELVDYPVDEALEMTKSIDPVLVDVCNTISI